MSINIKKSHKGLLHKNLGVKQGDSIPASKLKIKPTDSAAVKKRKQFAINAKSWHHGEDGLEIQPMQTPTYGQSAAALLTGIDMLLPNKKQHPTVIQPQLEYNPYQYGTGSQATMLSGGDVPKGKWNKVQMMGGGGTVDGEKKKAAKKVEAIPEGYNYVGEEDGKKYYNKKTNGQLAMATGAGKPGKDYDAWLQQQLQSGISPEELVQKKYISPSAVGKYKQYYKPQEDYVYLQNQQQQQAPQDHPAASFHGEPIFLNYGVTNKAIGMAKYPSRNTNTQTQTGNLNTGYEPVQFMYIDNMGKPDSSKGQYSIPWEDWNKHFGSSRHITGNDTSFINSYQPKMENGGSITPLDDNSIIPIESPKNQRKMTPKYKAGATYDLEHSEIKKLISQGYKIEYL